MDKFIKSIVYEDIKFKHNKQNRFITILQIFMNYESNFIGKLDSDLGTFELNILLEGKVRIHFFLK